MAGWRQAALRARVRHALEVKLLLRLLFIHLVAQLARMCVHFLPISEEDSSSDQLLLESISFLISRLKTRPLPPARPSCRVRAPLSSAARFASRSSGDIALALRLAPLALPAAT